MRDKTIGLLSIYPFKTHLSLSFFNGNIRPADVIYFFESILNAYIFYFNFVTRALMFELKVD